MRRFDSYQMHFLMPWEARERWNENACQIREMSWADRRFSLHSSPRNDIMGARANFKEIRTMELGHIFQLETRYSEMMNGKYINQEGKESLYYMGCYGIGVSRTLAALYEQCVVKNTKGEPCGFVLPNRIAPYMVQIIPKMENSEKVKIAEELYNSPTLKALGVILDDRENITMGAKIKDTKILGTPYMLVIGDKIDNDKLELEDNATGEKFIGTREEILGKILELKIN